MRAIETLRQEHEEIHEGLSVLLTIADKFAASERVDGGAVEQVLEFFEVFADGIHHMKEERILFPALERAGFPRTRGPLAVMFREHERARELLASMKSACDDLDAVPTARSRFVMAALEYADLVANHMGKEDGVLFEIAGRLIRGQDAAALDEEFERFDAGLTAARPRVPVLRAT